jgi:hypothetical protein
MKRKFSRSIAHRKGDSGAANQLMGLQQILLLEEEADASASSRQMAKSLEIKK